MAKGKLKCEDLPTNAKATTRQRIETAHAKANPPVKAKGKAKKKLGR